MSGKDKKGDDHIQKVVERGLEVLEDEKALADLAAKIEFLNDIKRGGMIGWRALVKYVLRDYPEEADRMLDKRKTTPRDK